MRNEFYYYICNKLSTGSIIKRTHQETTDKPERQSIARRNTELHTAISDGKHSTTKYSPADFSINLTQKGGVKKEEEERKGNELSEIKSNDPYCITIMLNPHK